MKTQIRKWMGGADEEEVERSDVKPPARRIKGKGGEGVPGIRPGAIRFRPKAMPGRKEKKEAGQKDKGGVTPPPPFIEGSAEWFGKASSMGYRGRCRGWPMRGGVIGRRGLSTLTGKIGYWDGDNPLSQCGEGEEEEGIKILQCGGYKRYHYERLTRAAGQQGPGCHGSTPVQKEGEEKSSRESRRSNRQSLGGWQSQKGEEGQETQVEEGRQEEEEEEEWGRPLELWGQQRFGRELRRIIHGPGQWVQRGVREPDEEEKPGSAWGSSGDVQHAKEQLEQSSTVSIPQQKSRVDQGVKLLSYFQQ